MGILLEALDKGDDNMNEIIDSMLDDQKIRNIKRKVVEEMHPNGQSFEAVAVLKSQLSRQGNDKFFIYKLNDIKMNDSISYVFKTSEPQIRMALSGQIWARSVSR
jgi:predicted RNA-binding protein with PUA domain